MAITTYSELQTAAANWLNRTDLTARVPEFITLAESRFRRDLRDWLRFTLSLTNVTADYPLAATVSEVLSVSYGDGANGAHNFALTMITREEYQGWMEFQSIPVATGGQLVYVDVDVDAPSTTLRFYPPVGATNPIANLKIEAIKVLEALSGSQTTNALLRDAPDVYLFGTLAESAPYLQHDERLPMWEQRMKDGLKGLRILTERKLYGGAPRPRKLDRVFG